jgi:hypothetical protein
MSLRASQHTKLNDNTAAPDKRPITNPACVSSYTPINTETNKSGNTKKTSPVIPSIRAVIIKSVFIFYPCRFNLI